jgi:hypothetical protein
MATATKTVHEWTDGVLTVSEVEMTPEEIKEQNEIENKQIGPVNE